MPLVRPGEHERASPARGEDRLDLPRHRRALALLPVAQTIEPDLRHHQRPIPRNVLQPRQVSLQPLARLEVDIETREIEKGQVKVFRRRIVDVSNQRRRIFQLHRSIKPADELLDLAMSVPADDRRRNLVSDCIRQQRRMVGARPHPVAHPLDDLRRTLAVVQKRDVLLPRQPHHYPQPLLGRHIHQPTWWNCVNPHGIDPRFSHQRKIAQNLRLPMILRPIRLGTKGTVSHPANVEFLVADEQEFARHPRALRAERLSRRRTRLQSRIARRYRGRKHGHGGTHIESAENGDRLSKG